MKTAVNKKPIFGKIFKKRLIIGLIIAALVFTAVLITAAFMYKGYLEEKGLDRVSKYYGTILNYYDAYEQSNENKDMAYNEFLYAMVGSISMDKAQAEDEGEPYIVWRLLDRNKNEVCSSNEFMALTVKEYDKEQDYNDVYLCHPDVFDKVFSAACEYDKEIIQKEDDGREYGIFVYETYLDGQYFYPRLSIRSMSKKEFYADNTDAEWKEEKSIEFYPEDTSGMRYIENKDKVTRMFFALWENSYDPSSDGKLDKLINESVKSGDPVYFFGSSSYEGMYTFSLDLYPSDANEPAQTEFTFVCGFENPFFKRFALTLILCAAGVIVITVLIAFVSSKIAYAGAKAQYDIFSARQETTRAMAHDLKTPLSSLSGYAELLLSNTEPEKRKHYLEMIMQNVSQMNNIVSDILKLSRSESDITELDIEAVDIAALCRELIDTFGGAFESAGLSCRLDVQNELSVKADRGLISQALSNLLHNALIYSSPSTTIDIILSERELYIVSVPEHMPDKPISELVKPFVKGNSHRGSDTCSGVGLSIAKHDLERMGFALEITADEGKFTALCRFNGR